MFWLYRGRSCLNSNLARRMQLDPAVLPYRQDVQSLRDQRDTGRELTMATAVDRRIATTIASHLNLFNTVIASDESRNCKGKEKLRAIRQYCPAGFAYTGNSSADLPPWREAGEVYVVAPSRLLCRRNAQIGWPVCVFAVARPRVRSILRLLRPQRWPEELFA
jgi:hypothetical protein